MSRLELRIALLVAGHEAGVALDQEQTRTMANRLVAWVRLLGPIDVEDES